MKMRLLMILCLVGSGFAFVQKPPDLGCTVIHLKYVKCLWNTSDVNYTFYSKFLEEPFRECDSYIVESGLNVGCKQPEDKLEIRRFNTFYTKLQQGDQINSQKHQLKHKVKLDPPSNLTVQFRNDSNLWFEWHQIFSNCVESQVRYRVNGNNWEMSMLSAGRQDYSIIIPSNSSRYELQVQSRFSYYCGRSEEWSEWSEMVKVFTVNLC